MASVDPRKWLLLIHQIPPKPNALRVKIWRRLQQVGAVAIKQSVYVMPLSEQSREDLSWTLKEIVEGGGDGSISEARFVEGLSDEQILTLFRNARKSDYEKFIQDAKPYSPIGLPRKATHRAPPQKVRRNYPDCSAGWMRLRPSISSRHRNAPPRNCCSRKLGNLLSGQSSAGPTAGEGIGDLIGKTWVTRENLLSTASPAAG